MPMQSVLRSKKIIVAMLAHVFVRIVGIYIKLFLTIQ